LRIFEEFRTTHINVGAGATRAQTPLQLKRAVWKGTKENSKKIFERKKFFE